MELTVTQILETEPEPNVVVFQPKTQKGLLNSNYKRIVSHNFRQPSTEVFTTKQRLKRFQFNKINHTAAILKLSVFAIFLIAIF